MKALSQHLKIHLIQLKEGSITKQDMANLLHLTRLFAETHLSHFRGSISALLYSHGLTFEDLALDCIANLFTKAHDAQYPILERFTHSLRLPLPSMPEHELTAAYQSLIATIANRNLARLYSQADPAGAKIHRNIRDCVRTMQIFSVTKSARGLVLMPANHDPLEHLSSIPREWLESELYNAITNERSTVELLSCLHNILVEQDEFRRSVTLAEVTQIFKKILKGAPPPDENEQAAVPFDHCSDLDIKIICDEVIRELKNKILSTYFMKKKMNRVEAEAIAASFEDLITDWTQEGEATQSLCRYLKRYLPIDEKIYETQYQSKIEYLYRFIKDEFHARLMDDI